MDCRWPHVSFLLSAEVVALLRDEPQSRASTCQCGSRCTVLAWTLFNTHQQKNIVPVALPHSGTSVPTFSKLWCRDCKTATESKRLQWPLETRLRTSGDQPPNAAVDVAFDIRRLIGFRLRHRFQTRGTSSDHEKSFGVWNLLRRFIPDDWKLNNVSQDQWNIKLCELAWCFNCVSFVVQYSVSSQ